MHSQVILVIFLVCFGSLNCLHGGKTSDISRLNFFDVDLLRYTAEERQGNVIISPASIKSTLAMLLEGARGNTEAEIRSALRLSPNKEEFRESLNLYISALQANTTGVYLQNTNAAFISNKLKLKKEYDLMIRKVYLSEVYNIDFVDPVNATDVINSWVNNRTKGLIPSIIDPVQLKQSSDIVLTNALYFKSSWKHAFDPRLTRGACFKIRGICKTVAMMELQAELPYVYVHNLRAHAIELPYEGERYSMILLVPQDHESGVDLIRDLPYMSLSQIYAMFEPTDVQLSLPKFTLDYNEDMVHSLRNMRINSLFSATANLTGMLEGESSQINNIIHRVHLSVDEIGTVAAAATSAMVIPLIENGVQLRVDRPFVFFIRDNNLGLVLFEGKVEEPTSYVEKNALSGQFTKKYSKNISTKGS